MLYTATLYHFVVVSAAGSSVSEEEKSGTLAIEIDDGPLVAHLMTDARLSVSTLPPFNNTLSTHLIK
jgi:hypothetical protein